MIIIISFIPSPPPHHFIHIHFRNRFNLTVGAVIIRFSFLIGVEPAVNSLRSWFLLKKGMATKRQWRFWERVLAIEDLILTAVQAARPKASCCCYIHVFECLLKHYLQ